MATPNLGPGYPAGTAAQSPKADIGSGGVAMVPAAQYEGAAFGTLTVGGTPALNNVLSATIANVAVTYTETGTDTNLTAATALKNAINANPTLSPLVSASASGAVVTVTAKAPGTVGLYELGASATGTSTLVASGTTLDFGAGVIVPNSTFPWAGVCGVETYYAGVPVSVDAATKVKLIAAGLAS